MEKGNIVGNPKLEQNGEIRSEKADERKKRVHAVEAVEAVDIVGAV